MDRRRIAEPPEAKFTGLYDALGVRFSEQIAAKPEWESGYPLFACPGCGGFSSHAKGGRTARHNRAAADEDLGEGPAGGADWSDGRLFRFGWTLLCRPSADVGASEGDR